MPRSYCEFPGCENCGPADIGADQPTARGGFLVVGTNAMLDPQVVAKHVSEQADQEGLEELEALQLEVAIAN